MRTMADAMGWADVVAADVGVVILTAVDCLHCIELEATLSEEPLDVPCDWIDKEDAVELLSQFPIFAASIDLLPCAGIFSDGEAKAVIRAATSQRIAEALASL
jgi:hypothetical protein